MPKIEYSIKVKATPQQLFELFKNFRGYKKLIPDIIEIKILKNIDFKYILSEWHAQFRSFKITWQQEVNLDLEKSIISFRQTEGDFNKYEGCWEYKEENGYTLVKLKLEYEFKIPIIGVFLNRMLNNRMEEIIKILLQSIKDEVEEEYGKQKI